MIIWLNGAFGAGKTTVAEEIHRLVPSVTIFDPELVGEMLTRIVAASTGDFQDLPAWRHVVAETAHSLVAHDPAPLVAPMTVLRRAYLDEMFRKLRQHEVDAFHVLLDVAPAELRRRIDGADPHLDAAVRGDRQRWRREHVDAYLAARTRLRGSADLVVDTTHTPVSDTARRVVAAAGVDLAAAATGTGADRFVPRATPDADRSRPSST